MFRKSIQSNISSYFLKRMFFSQTPKKFLDVQQKNNSSLNQNSNNFRKSQDPKEFQSIKTSNHVNDFSQGKQAIHDIFKAFSTDPQLHPTTISNHLTQLEKENLKGFKYKPGKLINLLQKIAKQNLEAHSDLIEQRKKIAKRITQFTLENFGSLHRIDVVMYLWLDYKLGIDNNSMIQKCLEFVERNYSELVEQDISTYLFSLAKISEREKHQSGPKTELAIVLKQHVQNIQPQLVESLRKIILTSKNEQHLTNMIWAIDHLQLKDEKLLEEYSKIFERPSLTLNNTNFSRIVNTITHMDYTPQSLFNYFTSEFLKRINTLSTKDFVSITRALYLSNSVVLIGLLNDIKPYIEKNLDKFTKEELVVLLVPFSNAKCNLETIDKLLNKIQESLTMLSKEDLCRTLWCLSVLQAPEKLNLMLEISDLIRTEDLSQMDKIELHQAAAGFLTLYLNLEKNEQNSSRIPMLKQKYEIVKEIITKQTLNIRARSFKEKNVGDFSVYKYLQALGLEVVPECIVEIYNVDFAIFGISKENLIELEKQIKADSFTFQSVSEEKTSKREAVDLNSDEDKSNILLIEVNGRMHYIGSSNILKGSTLLKSQHLKDLGYNCISMTQMDLVKINEVEPEKERFLAFIKYIKARM